MNADNKTTEKSEEIHIEDVSLAFKESITENSSSGNSGGTSHDERRTSDERALVRKIDMWLMPTVFLIWIMNYIDVRLLRLLL